MVKNTLLMMRGPAIGVLLAVLAGLHGLGCDWKTDGMARLDDLYPYPCPAADAVDTSAVPDQRSAREITDAPTPDAELGDTRPADLSGFWVMRMTLESKMDILGGCEQTITNLFLVEIPEDQSTAVLTYCHQHVFLDAFGLGETKMPEKTDEALAKVPIVLELAEGGGIAPQNVAWTWGIKGMEDPLKDEVPTNVDDPRLWDQDEDGFPGVTVTVIEPDGDRYMVRRAVWSLEESSTSTDRNWLTGKLAFTIDHVAIEATAPILLTLAEIYDAVERPNSYVLKRAGSITCKQLVEDQEQVFAQAPL